MLFSEILKQKLDEAKEEYLRVLELHESGKASLMLEHRQGYYDGVEKCWRTAVQFEQEHRILISKKKVQQ
jgi:hypothetical protein